MSHDNVVRLAGGPMTAAVAMVIGGSAFLVALATSWAAIPLLSRYAMDRPNERSSHAAPVPRAGGVAVGLATLAVTATYLQVSGQTIPWQVCIGLALFALLGLVDDIRSLGIRVRLVGQSVAALLAGSAVFADELWLLVAAGSFVVVGFVNAFNFMDGINGISSISTVVAVAWYVPILWSGEEWAYGAFALALGSATMGFAVPNVLGRLFLGDVGSYLLGSALAVLALVTWVSNGSLLQAAAPLALYVFETAFAICSRIVQHKPVGVPHRDHVYQKLVDAGYGHLVVASGVGLLSAVLCVTTAVLTEVPLVAFLVLVAVLAAYAASPRFLVRRVSS